MIYFCRFSFSKKRNETSLDEFGLEIYVGIGQRSVQLILDRVRNFLLLFKRILKNLFDRENWLAFWKNREQNYKEKTNFTTWCAIQAYVTSSLSKLDR